MSHDPNKVKMGNIGSNIKEIDNHPGQIEAGLAVRLKSDKTLSISSSDGSLIGVSVGQSLSKTKRTAVCRKGLDVPLILTDAFEPTIGSQVNVSNTTGRAAASGGGASAVNAVYKALKTGVKEDGTEVAVALIDFIGGL